MGIPQCKWGHYIRLKQYIFRSLAEESNPSSSEKPTGEESNPSSSEKPTGEESNPSSSEKPTGEESNPSSSEKPTGEESNPSSSTPAKRNRSCAEADQPAAKKTTTNKTWVTINKTRISNDDKDILLTGKWLNDVHIHAAHELLKKDCDLGGMQSTVRGVTRQKMGNDVAVGNSSRAATEGAMVVGEHVKAKHP